MLCNNSCHPWSFYKSYLSPDEQVLFVSCSKSSWHPFIKYVIHDSCELVASLVDCTSTICTG